MKGTLIQIVKGIERQPEYIGIDKNQAYYKTFEAWRVDNSLVDRIIYGKTSFLKETEKAVKKFEGWRNLTPIYLDKGYKKSIEELTECIDIPINNNMFTLTLNPVFWTTFLTLLTAKDSFKTKKISRRDFMRTLPISTTGALLGSGLSFAKYVSLENSRNEAMYLDTKIKEVYGNR